MADRPNHMQGYPMPQANLLNLTAQQQQQYMRAQAQAGANMQQIPRTMNPDQARLWQQAQASVGQRVQQMPGAEGFQQQVNPQVCIFFYTIPSPLPRSHAVW